MQWTNLETAGRLPVIFHNVDPRSAKEQIGANYAYGGGWHPFSGFTLHDANRVGVATLAYPEDPPERERSRAILHEGEKSQELIILFGHDWVAVVQADGSYEITRMD